MTNYHNEVIANCFSDLKSNTKGLSREEVKKRLAKNGLNELPKPKSLSRTKIFLLQFNNALVYILIAAGFLSFLLSEYLDAGVIFAAVIINVVIGFFQENKANNSIIKLRELVEHKTLVLRDNKEVLIDSSQVVVGDVIILTVGNRVPADARIFKEIDLQINESALTGESLPSSKTTETVPKGAALADRENMVFASTMIVRGRGEAIVTAVAIDTEIGKIASLVQNTNEEKTPLQIRLTHFSQLLGILFGIVCVIIVIAGLSQGRHFLEMIEVGVAVGVASIPEGLTVAVTFILALGMQEILKKRALTRKLIAAETLGSITVICTDKTGTLTEGKMHVAHIVIGEKEFELGSLGSRQNEKEALSVSLALQVAMMCNDATVENPDDELGSWRFNGSPTEIALLSAAVQSGLRKEKLLKIEPQIAELPFDSSKKFMLSLHHRGDNRFVLYEKGAPEKILEKATAFFHHGKICHLSASEKIKLNKVYEKLTSRGLRLIGLATRELSVKYKHEVLTDAKIDWKTLDKDLVFVGFIALKDPLRLEAKETITLCRQAGIRPIIITGDHRLTAKAIGQEIGLEVKAENIIEGERLENISDEELEKIVKKIDIYARVSPHHKLRIVKALQRKGEVVAMTGDGINDSPALKAADIGISLGTGTDIAKESSDIVLLDNNFKTIVAAIKQGRVIFKNIRKVITFLISDSFSEMILIVGSIVFNTPLALLPIQILWINIINDGFPHFSLAFERDHGAVMKEKPIKKQEPLLNKEMKRIIFGVGIARDILLFGLFFFLWLYWRESPEQIKYLSTLMFAILGTKSLIGIFGLRSFSQPIWHYNPFSNKVLLIAVSVSFSLLAMGIHWAPMQQILSTVDLDLIGWLLALVVGIFSLLMVELVKLSFYRVKE